MGIIQPGQPLRNVVPEVNRSVAVSDWYYREQELRRRGGPDRQTRDSGIVKVKNSSGGDLPAGSVVQLGGYLLNADHRFQDATLWLEGNTPTDPGAAERYAILRRPINMLETTINSINIAVTVRRDRCSAPEITDSHLVV